MLPQFFALQRARRFTGSQTSWICSNENAGARNGSSSPAAFCIRKRRCDFWPMRWAETSPSRRKPRHLCAAPRSMFWKSSARSRLRYANRNLSVMIAPSPQGIRFAGSVNAVLKISCQPSSSKTLSISPGRQRIVSAIGRQHTVQSSINDCSRCEVSIWRGNVSPQCGHVISVSTVSSILEKIAK